MALIVYILSTLEEKETAQILALSSVFGGAIGNYIDRLRFGYVIDFLDFHIPYSIPFTGIKGTYVYPAFNVADIAIVSGVSVLILVMFLQGRQEEKLQKADKQLQEATD
jgi:signal peptidase II